MARDLAAPLATDDRDTPTEVVGALALPSIDLARVGLPPLGWLFVGGAAIVAAMHMAWIVRVPAGVQVETLPADLLFAVASVALCLLPAALLRRAPDAIRTHRLLLAGLAAAAIAEIVRAVMSFILPFGPDEGSLLRAGLSAGLPIIGPLGSVLVGLGLLRLRAGAHARFGLLAAVALVYVALVLVPTLISTAAIDGLSASFFLVIVPLTMAFAVWVPVSAWLDHDPARAFWGLLALALPIALAIRALEIPQMVAVAAFRSNALFVAGTTFDAFAMTVIAVLALVAYGGLMPLASAAE